MRVEVLDLNSIPDVLAQRWRDIQALTPDFMSPLLGPDFALLIARYRPGAKLAIGYSDSKAVAFFAFHPTRSGYVRPIGAPFCDYQAIVSDPSVHINGLNFLENAGVLSLVCSGLSDPNKSFETNGMTYVDTYRIDCGGSGKAFLETLRVANPKWAKNLRRLGNKMDRELGPLRLVVNDTSQASFDVLMQIKIDQFRKTGVTNVLRPKWVKTFMQELFESRDSHFCGCLISLYSGDKFVAGQFGVRSGDWFHPWIASTCPLSHPYSPGIVFLAEMIKASDRAGLRVIDLSSGSGHYKSQFCRAPYRVRSGVLGSNPDTAPAQGDGALALISRRLDLIGAVETDLSGCLSALGSALIAIPTRLSARRNPSAPI